jgi:hypothetical protein
MDKRGGFREKLNNIALWIEIGLGPWGSMDGWCWVREDLGVKFLHKKEIGTNF